MGESRTDIICRSRKLIMDMETPLSFYIKVSNKSQQSFLLESVEGGERWGRFSFIGCNPLITMTLKGMSFRVNLKGKVKTITTRNPFLSIKKEIKKINLLGNVNLPRLAGGAVGYIGYDTVKFLEKLPVVEKEEINIPDIFLMLPSVLLVYDNLKHSLQIFSFSIIEDSERKAIKECEEILDETMQKLKTPNKYEIFLNLKNKRKVRFRSNFTKSEFIKRVSKVRNMILEGEAIQVVLSQRFESEFKGEPINVYRALRTINPSPYMFYLKVNDKFNLVGSSPEIMARVEGRKAIVRPIAGTRPRGKTDYEDSAYERDLLKDIKEGAEHVMLVDLGRNDIGKVCEKGSVRVEQFKVVERYSHVMHLVSHVTGKLLKGLDAFDVFAATFPAGTVTGAPKVRAMEIIEEMETVKRGAYAGAVGYFDLKGNMDMAITIRTILFHEEKAYVQAGAGIVADSNPEKEFQETVNKAKALFKAIEVAEG